mmetsp:Transcript_20980/g.37374  ORF Transcript_20980/g.37374 Transcript_20980/m.37374 type:complete len:250 (-) Transcript_20980:1409-2158(-)
MLGRLFSVGEWQRIALMSSPPSLAPASNAARCESCSSVVCSTKPRRRYDPSIASTSSPGSVLYTGVVGTIAPRRILESSPRSRRSSCVIVFGLSTLELKRLSFFTISEIGKFRGSELNFPRTELLWAIKPCKLCMSLKDSRPVGTTSHWICSRVSNGKRTKQMVSSPRASLRCSGKDGNPSDLHFLSAHSFMARKSAISGTLHTSKRRIAFIILSGCCVQLEQVMTASVCSRTHFQHLAFNSSETRVIR